MQVVYSIFSLTGVSSIGMGSGSNAGSPSGNSSTCRTIFGLPPSLGSATISGLIVSADDNTGLAIKVEPIILGETLENRI